MDRQAKQSYLDENVYAQGYETEDFLKVLAKEKGKQMIDWLIVVDMINNRIGTEYWLFWFAGTLGIGKEIRGRKTEQWGLGS